MGIHHRSFLIALALATFTVLVTSPSPAFADVEQYVVGVDGMACPFCAYGIEKKLKAVDGIDEVAIHIKKGEVDVPVQKTVTPGQLDTAIEKAGFEIRDLKVTGTGEIRTEGESVIVFSDELSLPLVGYDGGTGRFKVTGMVERKGDRWVLRISDQQASK